MSNKIWLTSQLRATGANGALLASINSVFTVISRKAGVWPRPLTSALSERIMKVKIEEIIPCDCRKCDEFTVVFSVSGNKYYAFGAIEAFSKGEIADVCFSHIEGTVSWEEKFNKNKDQKKSLIHIEKWAYDGLGQIISINPVIADFGDIELELGYFTHDTRCIGEYIYEKIDRLDIYREVTKRSR